MDKASSKIKKLQAKLKNGNSLPLYDERTLKYAIKPIGKAIYTANVGRPPKTEHAHWSDRVECHICGKTIIRSSRSNHNKTKYHQTYSKMGIKLQKILIDI